MNPSFLLISKPVKRLLPLCLFALLALPLQAQEQAKKKLVPAFPGAEGYARYITGGRGGKVYHVTSLTDADVEGTLRWAVNQTGARTIVFDVSGTIHLKEPLRIRRPNLTIAGQTAPGDGICIADYPFTIAARNVILRYLRFRLGNRNVTAKGADGWDGLGSVDSEDIMVDHCSVSWSIDECLSILGVKNATVQWCIVSQSLAKAGHSKGSHGYGGNWGGAGVSYHHNLMAHHVSRTPRLGPRYTTQMDERMDMRNNVIYNWAGNGCYGGEAMRVNIVNNYYKPGPATLTRKPNIQQRIAGIGVRTHDYIKKFSVYEPTLHIWGKYYLSGNMNTLYPEVTKDNYGPGFLDQIDGSRMDGTFTGTTRDTICAKEPIPFVHTTTHPTVDGYYKVLQFAGASLHRDAVDELIVEDTRNGEATYTGEGNPPGIINSQDDIRPANNYSLTWSAWPNLKQTATLRDSDRDGMPDEWEKANGLNPNDPDDRNLTDSEGYTNLERYMNSLVADITREQNEDGTVEGLAFIPKPEPKFFELNNDNANGDWTFSNDFSITTEKGYGGGRYGIKVSRGARYTINIPKGISITRMTIDGFTNSTDGPGWVGEVNGEQFDETKYVFPTKTGDRATDASHTFEFPEPVSGTITVRPMGQHMIWRFTLYPAKK